WRFLSLIVISSAVDYFIGLHLAKSQQQPLRKKLLVLSILVNIGFLGFFKYYNFFIDSFISSFTLFGLQLKPPLLEIILPVGISFYTFQTLSYTIDVYKGKLKPTRDILAFFSFVSFFPQLVAGPIERAKNLLPQFYSTRSFNYTMASDGMRQILWGFFKKIVVADNCAIYVNEIFGNNELYTGSTLFIGAILFAFQIYGDFSGYSDIAIGTAGLFGIELKKNFAFPYFSRNIGEFWRRWHISLTTWFRDYVYIPLGGSRGTKLLTIGNVFIIFLVSGLWHGANWTFICWGFVNACYFLPLLLLKRNRTYTNNVAQGKLFPSIKESVQILGTFVFTSLAWIFFRADNLAEAFSILGKVFSNEIFTKPEILPAKVLVIIGVLLAVEWFQRTKDHALQFKNSIKSRNLRWGIYLLVVIFILVFGEFNKNEFIYFAF
ncbi:MAG: MBOAT family protein, partial [Bacteroidales bacterium]|nr:MBOAT family protein [Bacteroidales bacterium]